MTPLSCKQRMCIFHDSKVDAGDPLSVADGDITFKLMRAFECRWQCIATAGVPFEELVLRGFTSPHEFRCMGMDAFDLEDISTTRLLVRAFGATMTTLAFLGTARDAVALAGTESARLLGVGLDELLKLCAGEPIGAETVLKRHGSPSLVLQATTIRRLRDTGICQRALRECGLTLALLLDARPPPTTADLSGFGFKTGV